MLVLSRGCDTAIRIGANIKIKVLSIRKQRVKLGIDAPSNVRVWRDEISGEGEPWETFEESRGSQRDLLAGIGADPFPVLVVEDDPDHSRLIRKALSDCHCPRVTMVPSGSAAIEALGAGGTSVQKVGKPHLMLLDLNLPDISGLEVLRQVRSHDRFHAMPIVVLSGLRQDALVAECLEAGANAFVNKSVHYHEFSKSVSRIATFWRSECRLPRAEAELSV